MTINPPAELACSSSPAGCRTRLSRFRSVGMAAAFALVFAGCATDSPAAEDGREPPAQEAGSVDDGSVDDEPAEDDAPESSSEDESGGEYDSDAELEDSQSTGDSENVRGEGTEEASNGDSSDPDGRQESGSASGAAYGEHRPDGAARGSVDCSAVTTPSPGAAIFFPDASDPASLQAGPGPVTVEVVGCSDTFEANVQYDAFHGQNSTPTLSGFTQGGTLGTFGEFTFEETFWTPGDWTVVVFEIDAESGDRVEYDQVTFTVE